MLHHQTILFYYYWFIILYFLFIYFGRRGCCYKRFNRSEDIVDHIRRPTFTYLIDYSNICIYRTYFFFFFKVYLVANHSLTATSVHPYWEQLDLLHLTHTLYTALQYPLFGNKFSQKTKSPQFCQSFSYTLTCIHVLNKMSSIIKCFRNLALKIQKYNIVAS